MKLDSPIKKSWSRKLLDQLSYSDFKGYLKSLKINQVTLPGSGALAPGSIKVKFAFSNLIYMVPGAGTEGAGFMESVG